MPGDHRQPAERDALPPDRCLHDLIVEPEAQRAGCLQSGLAVRREPAAPVEPGRAAFRIVEMEEHVPRQVGGRAQRRRAAHDLRARDRRHPLAEEAHRALRRRGLRQVADGDIDVAAREIDDAIVRRDIDLDVRTPLAKRREPRDDPQRGERHRRRQRESRRARAAARALRRSGKRRERVAHLAVKRRTGRRQRERPVPALEKRDAERVLQSLDLARQRRLREEQLLRGERERQPPASRLEAAEEIERRQRAQRLMHSPDSCESFVTSV